MECEHYKPDFHMRVLISVGKNENIKISPWPIEYHVHYKCCDKHKKEHDEHVKKSKLSEQDEESYKNGIRIMESQLEDMIE